MLKNKATPGVGRRCVCVCVCMPMYVLIIIHGRSPRPYHRPSYPYGSAGTEHCRFSLSDQAGLPCTTRARVPRRKMFGNWRERWGLHPTENRLCDGG